MANPVATAPPPHQRAQHAPPGGQPRRVIPFVGAAHIHREPISVDSFVIGAAPRPVPSPINITAYGYLKSVIVDTQWSGGVGGVFAADGPWNLYQSIWTQDVNGGFMVFPMDGFATLQINIYGAYAGRGDPRLSPLYVNTPTAGRFIMRLPCEINPRTGMGSLANQNAAEEYKLGYTTNGNGTVYSTLPTTQPTVTIRTYLEAWSQPDDFSLFGDPQATAPPRHGTSQYWSQNNPAVVAGNNNTQIIRMGNIIRALMVIARNNSAGQPRDDTVFPDPYQILWDAKQLLSESAALRQHLTAEALPPSETRDAGVYVFAFNAINHGIVGFDTPEMWLPTVQATRMEIDGPSATAGTLQVIVNDVAPAEVNPQRRYVDTAQTGQLAHPDLVAA